MIEPTKGFVLVDPVVRDLSTPAETSSGIILTSKDDSRPDLAVAEGTIVAGEAEVELAGKKLALGVGSKVYYNYFSGNQYLVERGVNAKEDKVLHFLWVNDILGTEMGVK